jgi:RNA-splicing ligase RtcB
MDTPRNGAAFMELPVCLPVLVIMIPGSMETSSAIFVGQASTTSAQEGDGRTIGRTGATISVVPAFIVNSTRENSVRIQLPLDRG